MAAPVAQNYANHRKFIPGFHILTLGLAVVYLLWALWRVIFHFSGDHLFELLPAVVLGLLAWYARNFPMVVQNRVIRLEERLRLERLVPELKGRIDELTAGQLIALRFASDAELPALTRRVLDEHIHDQNVIKKQIQAWRADHLRA
ncbi:MAG TPA: DUF6526 family protein [Thermoanaerobaculia bacterium]|jgi:hypothetical protein|nr:DUF6526 family protein [Thermoanaerobaculia bacterium]